jgi:hypothetical protein
LDDVEAIGGAVGASYGGADVAISAFEIGRVDSRIGRLFRGELMDPLARGRVVAVRGRFEDPAAVGGGRKSE